MPEAKIVYDPNFPMAFVGGEIIPTGKKPISASEIMDGLQTALSREYRGKDQNKIGLTKAEAMLDSLADKAADGDLDAISKTLDRVLGKPIQQVQSLNVNTSLTEFLDQLRARREARMAPAEAPF